MDITQQQHEALNILACPHCRAFPLRPCEDKSLLCHVCLTGYSQIAGIYDLRPPEHDESGAYQGDTPEAVALRNKWDSILLPKQPGVEAAIYQVTSRSFPGCQILDVGCATGHITRWIAERSAGGVQLWAIDVSEPMCQFAQQNCDGLNNVTVVRAVSSSLPFQNGVFDVVSERLAPMEIELAYELLRPGGWFIESGLGDLHWKEVDEVFEGRSITFPNDTMAPKQRLTWSGFTEVEYYDWRYTREYTLDEIISIIRFAPILQSFDEQEDAPLLEILRQRHGTTQGIALTNEETLLFGKKRA